MSRDELQQIIPPKIDANNAWIVWDIIDLNYQIEIAKCQARDMEIWGDKYRPPDSTESVPIHQDSLELPF